MQLTVKRTYLPQQLEWYSAKSPNTKAYEKYLLLHLVNSTIEDVSIKEGLGYKA